MKSLPYLLILSLIANAYFLFRDNPIASDYERIKKEAIRQMQINDSITKVNDDLIVRVNAGIEARDERSDKVETKKQQSNEKTNIRVSIIRNDVIDTVIAISAGQFAPDGY